MRRKPVTSEERAIILNVFKHLKGNFPPESQGSIIERTSNAIKVEKGTIRAVAERKQSKFSI